MEEIFVFFFPQKNIDTNNSKQIYIYKAKRHNNNGTSHTKRFDVFLDIKLARFQPKPDFINYITRLKHLFCVHFFFSNTTYLFNAFFYHFLQITTMCALKDEKTNILYPESNQYICHTISRKTNSLIIILFSAFIRTKIVFRCIYTRHYLYERKLYVTALLLTVCRTENILFAALLVVLHFLSSVYK